MLFVRKSSIPLIAFSIAYEAEKLSGIKINTIEDAKISSEYFIEKGVGSVFITLGSDGVYCANKHESLHIEGIKINIVNATGAGDAFVGAVLKQLSDIEDKRSIGFEQWKSIVAFANKVGAITCTNYGAIASMPTLAEIELY